MLMEGWVKFFSPQNTAGGSQEKGVAVIPQTIDVNGDQVSNVKKTKQTDKKIYKMPPYSSTEVIQVS